MAKTDQLGNSLERPGVSQNSNNTEKTESATGQRGSTAAAEPASFVCGGDRAEDFVSDFTGISSAI